MNTSAPILARLERIRLTTDWQLFFWKVRQAIAKIVIHIILVAGAIVFAAPFVWMLSTSFKSEATAYKIPVEWIPKPIRWQNYVEAWQMQPFPLFYRNTIFLTAVNIVGVTLSSSLVAFAFARVRFWGRDTLFLILLATMMLPGQVTLIPIYVVWSRLKAVNTYWPLIIPEWLGTAYNIFLLRQYMMTITPEMDDAARIDGASWFRIYSQIIIPMSAPALGVVAIQAFSWNWNSFMGPLIYLNTRDKFTISIGLRLFQSQMSQYMPYTMAMSVVALIPVLIVFFIAQRYFIQGIVITGVKG